MPSYANYPAIFASESAKINFVKLLVFRVMSFQIDQNKNQNRSIDKLQNQRKKRKEYEDSRQNSIHSNFSYARYTEKTFYPNLFASRCHASAHPGGHQHGGGNQQKHLSLSFATKTVKLSLEELKNIKIILFLIQEMLRQLNSPK